LDSSLPSGWDNLLDMTLPIVAAILLLSAADVRASAGGRCSSGFELLHSPYVDRSAKTAIAQSMREAGCLGRRPHPRRGRPRRQSDDEPPA
jgi:hypothetical protein